MIDINTFEDGDSRVTVSVGSGQTIVESTSSRNLTTQVNGFGFKDVLWVDPDGATINITDDISNGKLKGWLESRDVDMRGYLRQLDSLAEAMTERVNTLHQAGWGLASSRPPTTTEVTGLAPAGYAPDMQC